MTNALSSTLCGQVEYHSSCFLAKSDMAAGRADRMSVRSRGGKCVARTKRAIHPGFLSETIREPTVRSTDGDVQDQIEGCPSTVSKSVRLAQPERVRTLVEWRSWTSVGPGVPQRNVLGTIDDDLREFTTLPERPVDIESHHTVKSVVDVNATVKRFVVSTHVVP